MDNVPSVKEAKALMNNAQILINLDDNGKEILGEFYNNIKQYDVSNIKAYNLFMERIYKAAISYDNQIKKNYSLCFNEKRKIK